MGLGICRRAGRRGFVATRRGFHVAFAVSGLKPTATGNRRDATADERRRLRGKRRGRWRARGRETERKLGKCEEWERVKGEWRGRR